MAVVEPFPLKDFLPMEHLYPQYHWHNVVLVGTDAEARERLVPLERKVCAVKQQTEEREAELLA